MRTFDAFDDLVSLVRRRPELFIRYSEGPEVDARGCSVDYESGIELPGWSVTTLGPEAWWSRPLEDWVARQVCKYAELADGAAGRRPWVLAGRVVGRGPDHEPLVVDVDPVGWISPGVLAEAKRRYHSRFDVGRDSTGAGSSAAG